MIKTNFVDVEAPEANIDDDVLAERRRVMQEVHDTKRVKAQDDSNYDALVVYRLAKNFKRLKAVNNLSFGVHQNECFGLLGINGAGKTTTFKYDSILLLRENWFMNSYLSGC